MEAVIRKHMNNKGTEPDLRTQFTIYEVTTRNGDLNTFPFLRNTCCLQTDVFFSESLGESALPAGPECYSCPAVVQPLKTFTVINKKSWLHLGFLCILHNIPTLSADTARFRMCVCTVMPLQCVTSSNRRIYGANMRSIEFMSRTSVTSTIIIQSCDFCYPLYEGS